MEHFPYINSLWFGESYDYNESPDYWLVEVSGIPFGLFGEMLEGNGNPWRGMVYGMTARYYQGADPKHIWKVWDEFGIQDARDDRLLGSGVSGESQPRGNSSYRISQEEKSFDLNRQLGQRGRGLPIRD